MNHQSSLDHSAGPVALEDAVATEIIAQRLSAAVHEMVATIHRTARSPFVKEAMDFGVGITDPHGNMIGYPRGANTFAIDRHFSSLTKAFDHLEPGDIIGTSDPYLFGRSRPPTVPISTSCSRCSTRARWSVFAWCFAHLTDVGGAVPGSLGARLSDIYQEGVRFPPMKIVRKGEINPTFEKIFYANTRIPEINAGDFQALLASLAVAEKRMTELCERFGAEFILAASESLLDYAARKAREIPAQNP